MLSTLQCWRVAALHTLAHSWVSALPTGRQSLPGLVPHIRSPLGTCTEFPIMILAHELKPSRGWTPPSVCREPSAGHPCAPLGSAAGDTVPSPLRSPAVPRAVPSGQRTAQPASVYVPGQTFPFVLLPASTMSLNAPAPSLVFTRRVYL